MNNVRCLLPPIDKQLRNEGRADARILCNGHKRLTTLTRSDHGRFASRSFAAVGAAALAVSAAVVIVTGLIPTLLLQLTIGELAETMLLKSHGLSEMADRLAKQGLVERVRSDTDRRRINLRLTGKATELLS